MAKFFIVHFVTPVQNLKPFLQKLYRVEHFEE